MTTTEVSKSEELGLPMFDLGCELVVSTPTSRQVLMSLVCVRCSLEVAWCIFNVNLVCLPLAGLDVVLGIDWMTTNGVLIDYGQKRVIFPEEVQVKTITSRDVLQDIRERAICYVAKEIKKKKSVEEKIVGIPIVEEFADVFPDEVLGLPPI
ncbi:uncharacterized protein LOC106770130 [Vigna radiata var. radiata]|uniref:Uncharacterized protein LOC106770130 n=1 Tax=Vigna radiata var. radiata TaxID=3916 RepID=A0A1S3UZG1_VIGRR|nr:uncharacterized protein LOC106770130 [Vigna radiata var. radiata]